VTFPLASSQPPPEKDRRRWLCERASFQRGCDLVEHGLDGTGVGLPDVAFLVRPYGQGLDPSAGRTRRRDQDDGCRDEHAKEGEQQVVDHREDGVDDEGDEACLTASGPRRPLVVNRLPPWQLEACHVDLPLSPVRRGDDARRPQERHGLGRREQSHTRILGRCRERPLAWASVRECHQITARDTVALERCTKSDRVSVGATRKSEVIVMFKWIRSRRTRRERDFEPESAEDKHDSGEEEYASHEEDEREVAPSDLTRVKTDDI
jgi:hypothetical protein